MSVCRHLEQWLNEPGSSVAVGAATGTLSLRIGNVATIEPLHCTFCGGHGDRTDPTQKHYPKCSCSTLHQLLSTAPDFIEFDTKFNEYHWLFPNGGYLLFYFCPACGGQLPKSHRGDFFTKPTFFDRASAKLKMRKIKSVDDMKRVLGTPTHEFQHCSSNSCGYKAQYTYTELWESLELHVQEQYDGSVTMSWSGKYKQNAT